MAQLHSGMAICAQADSTFDNVVRPIHTYSPSILSYSMHSHPTSVPTQPDEEHALLTVREARSDPAERRLGWHSSRCLFGLAAFLVLGAMWTVRHQNPAEVAQRAAVSKTASNEDASADTQWDAIATGSEGMAAMISSSVTLAVSDSGAFETAENRKATGDLLKACGSACLAVTGILAVESAGAALPAEAACVPLIVAGSAISAFNDDALSTNDLSHMMNARFDKLSERIDQGFGSLADKLEGLFHSLTDKLEGLVQDINKDQASKQFETLSTINECFRHMWEYIREDALTEKSLPNQVRIVEFRVKLLPTVLAEFLQNVFLSGALVLEVLHAAVGFVAARSQLYAIELLRCALDGDGTCQPGLTDDYMEKLDEDLRGCEPIVEAWKCHYAVLAAGQEYLTGVQYVLCLPANSTYVSGTSLVGELKDLPASVTYVDVAGTSVGGELKDLPASVTVVDVSGTSVTGELKDLSASVTVVDVSGTSVTGELKDLPASVTDVHVYDTSVVGELKDLPAAVTSVYVAGTSVGGRAQRSPRLRHLRRCVRHFGHRRAQRSARLRHRRRCVRHFGHRRAQGSPRLRHFRLCAGHFGRRRAQRSPRLRHRRRCVRHFGHRRAQGSPGLRY